MYFRTFLVLNRVRVSDPQRHLYTQTWVKCPPNPPRACYLQLNPFPLNVVAQLILTIMNSSYLEQFLFPLPVRGTWGVTVFFHRFAKPNPGCRSPSFDKQMGIAPIIKFRKVLGVNSFFSKRYNCYVIYMQVYFDISQASVTSCSDVVLRKKNFPTLFRHISQLFRLIFSNKSSGYNTSK